MEDTDFDRALIAAVFDQAALRGWPDINVAEAARTAGLPLARTRARFPGRGAVLLRFGIMADGMALGAGGAEESPRERLFDILMSRFDALQQHRAGMLALLAALRFDPATSLLLYGATLQSMKWLLDGAGIPSNGIVGTLRIQGLLALWLYALRAWERDESPDLSATMAAVDRGLDRAIQAENILPGRYVSPAEAAAQVFEAGGLVEDPVAEADADAATGTNLLPPASDPSDTDPSAFDPPAPPPP